MHDRFVFFHVTLIQYAFIFMFMVSLKHQDRKINMPVTFVKKKYMHRKTGTCSRKYPLHLIKFADSGYYAFFSLISSTGRRPASLCHGPLSVVRPSVRPSVHALTFSLNIFFAETTYRILMKFHRNVPTMVLFRIS